MPDAKSPVLSLVADAERTANEVTVGLPPPPSVNAPQLARQVLQEIVELSGRTWASDTEREFAMIIIHETATKALAQMGG